MNVGAVLIADLQAPEASLSRPTPLVTPCNTSTATAPDHGGLNDETPCATSRDM